ncbi:MAG: cation transporter [Bacteroidales bacterium]|nr:cation transporter [Bacteroidales bacterium]
MHVKKREDEITRVTLAGSVVNLLLVGLKALAGVAGHSAAMVSDAVHSLSDFVTDIVVLVFVRVSARPQDEGHDYGHGKFETLATLFIGLALAAAAVGIVVSGATKLASWLQGEDLPSPGKIALWAALISIITKEILFQYTRIKGRKLNSPALEANAWHHRSDALSSIGAAIGIGGAIVLGERWTVLDPLASIVVGAMLVKVAWDLLGPSFGELTDSSLPTDMEQEMLRIISAVEGVEDPHNLRTRRIGNHIAAEVHIRLDGKLTLESAHEKASEVERRFKERFGKESHIIIHMEPRKTHNP